VSKIIAEYERVTGESFEAACKRLARENCCGYMAAELIGFTSKQGLDYAMKKRGIEVIFRSVKLPGKSDRAGRYLRAKLRKEGKLPPISKSPAKSSKTQSEHYWRKLNQGIEGNNAESK
jgi:hypothetical protein